MNHIQEDFLLMNLEPQDMMELLLGEKQKLQNILLWLMEKLKSGMLKIYGALLNYDWKGIEKKA